MNDQEYIKQLEETIARFLAPLKDIPFPVIMKAITGCEILPFDLSDDRNKKLLCQLSKAARVAGEKAFQSGIVTSRPNEAGNCMESFVMDALQEVGLKAERPVSRAGAKKIAGYPDIRIKDSAGKTVAYLDCKTYSTKTKDQSFRTFYFSPSEDPKVTEDAFHLLMSFELSTKRKENQKVFVPISWQIYTLDKLRLQVKHEFNASNRELYTEEALLAHGKINI